jgi:beta-galactosidase
LWIALAAGAAAAGEDPVLPPGVRAVWDAARAHRESTPTRERISINGLWRWQPAEPGAEPVPEKGWGYFKVPGCWPGIADYMQKDCQAVFPHPSWKDRKLDRITAAWYQREIDIPGGWAGRRIAFSVDSLNSLATVYVDGQKAGDLRFPAGELDLTPVCRPGGKHLLSLLVTAVPLQGVMLAYTDSAHAREVKGKVERRGLCGDVWLAGEPAGARIGDVKVDTSVRKGEIAFGASLEGLAADGEYSLRARISDGKNDVAEFKSRSFHGSDLHDGRMDFNEKWRPDRLWDIHTPENVDLASLSLLDSAGAILDVAGAVRFGYREFWIDGRDFYLNGTRIYLCAVPLDNASVSAAAAGYGEARESLLRLQSFGINFVYTHNYSCVPGSHLSFAEVLRAADDVGMLVALSQPHFEHYDWKAADADTSNGYARHAGFYVRVAENHPAVVAYAMSHNATGYDEDMNPDLIDGVHAPRDEWGDRNAAKALRAEAIVKRLDPGRIVYHHASGNLGSLHAINFYPNFVPIQELSDWFEHWASEGVKPVFTCEYGAPFTWDWTMYRGFYKGQREWGSAVVPWDFCLAEWNAQLLGDAAYRISEAEKANLRWEAKKFRAGALWHRWDYPNEVGSPRFEERYPVFARYLTDNWRAFRGLGVSAISPWEYGHFWKPREGVDRRRRDLPVDWEKLQRPGFSPDYLADQYERMDLAFDRSDWVPTAAAEALIRNNLPLLGFIGGKPQRFTSKDHLFRPGEVVEKQLVVLNNSRRTVSCECSWSLGLPQPISGKQTVTMATGDAARIPLRFELPPGLPAVDYRLEASFDFAGGAKQQDSFAIHVIEPTPAPNLKSEVALFDPKGETAALLRGMAVGFKPVDASADLASFGILVVGKGALTVDGPAPDIARVREGLKVIVFEQAPEVLEKRFGFRVAEYGLRQVFRRVKDHPLLAGLAEEHLRDWRGAATILPPRLDYKLEPRRGPTVKWCDISVPRLWRCGNRGNVASVLIEKPARGDFLPILDGGYALQYAPLVLDREGKGMVLFCQMDVTGRTEADPAAERLARNILEFASSWEPPPPASRAAIYAGEPAGLEYLRSAGLGASPYAGGDLPDGQLLVVGPGGGKALAGRAAGIARWLDGGGHLLAVGLDQEEAGALVPFKVAMKKSEHIASCFEPFSMSSPFAGVGPADVHDRDPRELPLVVSGAAVVGDGVLAAAGESSVVFCQLAPWQFEGPAWNLKKTRRRVSFLLARILANLGAAGATPVLERFHAPLDPAKPEKRWLDGLYLDQPEEWDDPYRFFRW